MLVEKQEKGVPWRNDVNDSGLDCPLSNTCKDEGTKLEFLFSAPGGCKGVFALAWSSCHGAALPVLSM